MLRNLRKSVIPVGNPHIFRLSSVNPASQSPASQRVAAVIYKASLTVKTASAVGLHIHRYSVPGLYLFYGFSGLFHYAYKLMSQDSPRHSPWHCSMLNVNIAGTYSGQSHLHQHIGILFQAWLGALCKNQFPFFLKNYCFHKCRLSFIPECSPVPPSRFLHRHRWASAGLLLEILPHFLPLVRQEDRNA